MSLNLRSRSQVGFSDQESQKELAGRHDMGTDRQKAGHASDFNSLLLLGVLYTLQGIPMGLHGSIPLILAKKISYKEQALFSLCSWPFSLKLFWAPMVDALYVKRIGRRKSWLIPVQLLCGLMMLVGSSTINDWVGETPGTQPEVSILSIYFFVLYFLMATQDIAVDGWAITMLSDSNKGLAAVCNSVGQNVGYFISYVGFLTLNDPAVCNKYLRSVPNVDEGLVSLAGFMAFFGWVFVGTTLYVWIFKTEAIAEEPPALSETYGQLWSVMKLPAMRTLIVVLFTCKMPFAVTDGATTIKFVEYGLPKEQIAAFAPVLVLVGVVVPVLLNRLTAGTSGTESNVGHGDGAARKPRDIIFFLAGIPIRMVAGGITFLSLSFAKDIYRNPDPMVPVWFYGFLIFSIVFQNVASNVMFVTQMSFFARVSDPSIGGTYMTLLNTLANLGSKWPTSTSLSLLDFLTTKKCIHLDAGRPGGLFRRNRATSSALREVVALSCAGAIPNACTRAGSTCETIVDGYDVQFYVCSAIGAVWIALLWKKVLALQSLPESDWHISRPKDHGT